MAELRPLVLDVDGTFLKTDMLFECFWAGLGRAPLATLKACALHFRQPQRLKAELAQIAPLRTDLLPVNPDVAGYAASAVADGRDVVLASASDQTLVRALADEYALSETVFASDGETNLKGQAKAEALVAAFGERGFDYAGDAPVDLKIWDLADGALIVGKQDATAEALKAAGHRVTRVEGGWSLRDFGALASVILTPLVAAVAEFVGSGETSLASVRFVGYDDTMAQRFASAINSLVAEA